MSLILEEPSNTCIKKQVKVTRKKKEIINDKSPMQDVMEPILDQLGEKLLYKFQKNQYLTFQYKMKNPLKFLFNIEKSRILFLHQTIYKKNMGSKRY